MKGRSGGGRVVSGVGEGGEWGGGGRVGSDGGEGGEWGGGGW